MIRLLFHSGIFAVSLFALLISIPHPLAAQEEGEQAGHERALASTPERSRARVEKLNALARLLQETNTIRALALVQEAQAISMELKWETGTADALRIEGNCHLSAGRPEQALVKYQQALTIYRKTRNGSGIGRTLYNIGVYHARTGRLDKAREQFVGSFNAYRTAKDRMGLAFIYVQVGTLYARMAPRHSARDSALLFYEMGLKIYNGSGDKKNASTALVEMGWIHVRGNAYASALRCAEKGLKAAEDAGDLFNAAQASELMSAVYLLQSAFEKSRLFALQAFRRYQQLGDSNRIGHALVILGNIWADSNGPVDSAIACYQQSARIFEKQRDPEDLVTALNAIAQCYQRRGSPGKGIPYAQRGLEVAQRAGERVKRRRMMGTLELLGTLHTEIGAHEKAAEYLRQFLRMCEEDGDPSMIAGALSNLAAAYAGMGAYERALDCLRRAQKIALEAGDMSKMGRISSTLAYIYMMNGKGEKSAYHAKEALKFLDRAADRRGASGVLLNLGGLQIRARSYDEALRIFEPLSREFEALKDSNDLAAVLINIGICYNRKKEVARAIEYGKRGLAIAEAAGNKLWMANALRNLGQYTNYIRDDSSSLDYSERSLALYRELANKEGIAVNLNNIGDILTRRGEHQRALETLMTSLPICEEIGDPMNLGEVLFCIGWLYVEMHMPDRALRSFERAKGSWEAVQDRYQVGWAYRGMAIACKLQGSDSLALRYGRESLALAEEQNDKELQGLALEIIGEAYGGLGDLRNARISYEKGIDMLVAGGEKDISCTLTRRAIAYAEEGKSEEAELYLKRALDLAKENSETKCLEDNHRALSELFAFRGDSGAALKHYTTYVALRDSSARERNRQAIDELNAKYDADRREKAIALLEKDKSLRELELRRRGDQLLRQRLDADRRGQRIRLLEQEGEIRELELARSTSEKKGKLREVALLTRDKDLQASQLARERLLRNSVLGGLALLVAVGFLGYKRVQGRKREAMLRAEAAEYQAKAAEAQALALQAETISREKEAQQLFTKRLISSQEGERKRISTELHDSLSQELIVIRNQALLMKENSRFADSFGRQIDQIVEMASVALTDVRQISRALRPYQIDQVGLSETLRSTLAKIAETAPFRLESDIENIDGMFTREEEINLFRLVQESVNNILKHAQATEASVRLKREADIVRLSVRDDGAGFDTEAIRSGLSAGLGIRSMTERVQMLEGRMNIDSSPGNGTRIEVSLPVKQG